jgi:hypothetical protein
MVQIHSPRPFIPVSLFQRFMKELLFSFPRYKWVHWVQKGVDREPESTTFRCENSEVEVHREISIDGLRVVRPESRWRALTE